MAPESPPTGNEQTEALRAYAAGREKLLRGDSAGSLADLRRAAELDPTSGEVWLALGDAQGSTGARAESLASIERAAQLGAGGARPWEILGRMALSAGDLERAASLLARAALQPESQGSDPALHSLIGIELGQALDGLGYTRAAVGSLSASLALLESVQGTQRYRAEIAAIARRRGDLWIRVGDLACKAGDYAAAEAAYDTAWGLPTLGAEREGLLDRRVYAGLRTGRPAQAATAIYESVVSRQGWVSDSDRSLCGYLLAQAPGEAPAALSAALAEYARSRHPAPSPAIDTRLVLSRAALVPAREASSLLQSHLKDHPGDDAAALKLLELLGASSVDGAAGAAVMLTRAAPLRAETYARALLTIGPVSQLLEGIDRANGGAAADLLAGRVFGAVDQTEEALARLDEAAASSKRGSLLNLGAELAIAEVAGGSGLWQRLDRASSAIDGQWPGLDQRQVLWARAGARAAGQRFASAFELLRQLAELPPDRASDATHLEALLAAGELAGRLALADEAERWTRQASELDAHDERAYTRLLGLYVAEGPIADQAKFAEALRRLRQNCPDGRVLRTLRAQDLIRRGSPDEGLRQSLALASEDAADLAALELLITACERWSSQKGGAEVPGAAEAYLRSRRDRAPDDTAVVIALARILVSGGRVPEAEATLRSSLAASPQREVSRALERLLRRTPSGAEEADTLALARLAGQGTPGRASRSMTESIELAELLQHLDRTPEAVVVLSEGIPDTATLTPSQSQLLIEIARRATTDEPTAPDPIGLALLDLTAARGVRLPRELQGRRLSLLVIDPRTSPEVLLAAAQQMQRDFPDRATLPYLFILRNLSVVDAADASPGAPAGARALAFAALAAGVRPDAEILADWLRLIAAAGASEDGRSMIDAALAARMESEVIRNITATADQPVPPAPSGAAAGAELAQLMGDFASILGREEQSAAFYRLGLSYDPQHAWAANNLGYHLAESARRPDGSIDLAALEEAERLLTIASSQLPDDGSILDSLGWVRYRRGVVLDQKGADGRTTLEGAVTLLARAARTSKGQDNETILDHLGDALWLAGNHDAATGAWSLAEQSARQQLDRLRTASAPRRAVEELTALLASVSAKLAAARAGIPPQTGWTTSGS